MRIYKFKIIAPIPWHYDTQHNDIQPNDTPYHLSNRDNQHNGTLYCYAFMRNQAHYADCRYAECRGANALYLFGLDYLLDDRVDGQSFIFDVGLLGPML